MFEKLQSIVTVATAAHGLAVVVCNMTKTPKDDAVVSKVYRGIEILAGIITPRAKQ